MKVRVSYREGNRADHRDLAGRIEGWADEHLEPMLAKQGFADAELNAVVEKRAKGAAKYRVKLHLHVPPKKVLVARADGDDPATLAREALERLRRELKKHIERVRHQDEYRRKARRKRLRERKAQLGGMPVEMVEQADRQSQPLRPRLERVIRRELAYLRAQGDLPRDYPTVQDVLDEVMLMVAGDWREEGGEALYARMLKAMREVLDREVRESRVFGAAVSLEEAPEEDAEDQAEEMTEEEFTEFWQPDEALRVEDVVPNIEAEEPEQTLEALEERAEEALYLLELMRSLPIDWRRALMLHVVDGVSLETLATSFERSPGEVRAWIDSASDFLDARLVDAGFAADARRLLAAQAG